MHNYLNNMGVRGKLVLLISLLVFVVLGSVLCLVFVGTSSQVETLVKQNMNSRGDAFAHAEQYRIRDRAHITSLIAMHLLEQTGEFPDQAHACDFFLKRLFQAHGSDPNDSPRADFAELQDANGTVVAVAMQGACNSALRGSRDLPNIGAVLDSAANAEACGAAAPTPGAVAPARSCPLRTTWKDDRTGAIYSVYAARIKKTDLAGAPPSLPLGIVTLGYKIDDEYATRACARAGGSVNGGNAVDVVFWVPSDKASGQTVIACSNPQLAAQLDGLHLNSLDGSVFKIAGTEYFLKAEFPQPVGVQGKNPEHVRMALIESYTAQMKPFNVLRGYLYILAVVSVLIGIGLGILFSAPMIKPLIGLAKVAGEVELGKFDTINQLKLQHRNAFESRDEIGILCRAFEEMVAGLKKRNAMTKFMSAAALKSMGDSGSLNQAGQRMWMVVLFSDIRGFTKYSEGRDPQTVVQRLNEVLGIQAEYVTKHGGDIDKFIGDAMVAWFTGPDRCGRAVAAAAEMMAGLSSRIGESAGRQIGVGIHLGEVIVGALGAQDRQDYTAIGSSVNLAARLCSAAKSGQILISQTVVTELDGTVKLNPLPPVSLKGFAEPTPVYEVVLDHAPNRQPAEPQDVHMAKA
jgi:class 3 adenylate cyclase